jgi:hypothetical protein
MKYVWLITLIFVVGFSSSAFSWGGKLSNPLFGYPKELKADQQKKAEIALAFMRDELKFIDGQFINTFVTHQFGGTFGRSDQLRLDVL